MSEYPFSYSLNYVTDATELGKDLPSSGTSFDANPSKQPKAKKISRGGQYREVPLMPWQSEASSSNDLNNVSINSAKVITSSRKTSTEEDSSRKLKNTTVETAIPLDKPYSKEDVQLEDSKESNPEDENVKAENPTVEDVKPPPLAGPNVMNVIIVAAECAPWIKTGTHFLWVSF